MTTSGIKNDERRWNWSQLREEFLEQNLESLFELYVSKLQHAYYSLFLIQEIVLSLAHVVALLVASNMKISNLLLPDVSCYSIIAVVSLITLLMKETLGQTCSDFPLSITVLTVLFMVTINFLVPLYHSSDMLLRPAYTTHIVLACYVFLPISNNLTSFIFGFAVTLCHLVVLGLLTYKKTTENFTTKLGIDVIFLACINGLGLYFRFMNEILKRRTFLDRRACVESTVKLKHEKEQEEQLMLSILPQHIAVRVREDIKKTLMQMEQKLNVLPEKKPFRDLFIEKHDNVTILYADIVNYTEMTRKLPVIKLVETLNELFGKFDDASEEHDVLRIKFLGDCYYCVAGLPVPNPNHATACVELGLDMITIIQKIRKKKNLNIDMRIGVHSGSIMGGLIGECKWQYDIWSKDVRIANRMEQTGEPGMVHITHETLRQLKGKYSYKKSTACNTDDFLNQLGIETFLISPQTDNIKDDYLPSILNRRLDQSMNKSYPRCIQSITNKNMLVSNRRTVFMNHNIKKYQLRIKEIELNLEDAIMKLPLRKFEQWFRWPGINPILLIFRDLKMELPYLAMPDPLFKYYLLSSVFILAVLLIVQHFLLLKWDWKMWLILTTLVLSIIFLLPLAWFYSIVKKVFSLKEAAWKNRILRSFKYISKLIVSSTPLRVAIYVTVSSLIAACIDLDTNNCGNISDKNSTEIELNKFRISCDNISWHITEACSLGIIASFLFLRMYLGLKFIVGLTITVFFSFNMWNFDPDYLFIHETWNPHLKPQIACIMFITFLTFTLHLIDRQSEYLNRLDYQWQQQLSHEQQEAEKMCELNNMLLKNILPIHVVEVYLNTNRSTDDLYHEQYKSVAVMFASIVDYTLEMDDEFLILKIMNTIICDFDKLLMKPYNKKIEKIKVAGWTYMAACGLDPGRKDSTTSVHQQSDNNIVVQLVKFGLNMMKVLDKINRTETYQDFKLRIGISHGEVTAGVVGSKKPLYDIWGDAVNMASRMDSTGQAGKIQVTENTANILQKQGINCTYRGLTLVKNIGQIPTYFVDLDDNLIGNIDM